MRNKFLAPGDTRPTFSLKNHPTRRGKASMQVLFVAACLFLCIQQAQPQPAVHNTVPNIIVFLVDDMGWMDTSVPFGDSVMALNRRFYTPNMERMARQGMRFTRAYAQPVCSPSRTSLLTGMHPARTHITNWVNTLPHTGTDHPDSLLLPPSWNTNGLSPVVSPQTFTAPLLPQLLRDAGYYAVHAGKAHWGSQGSPGSDPLNMGFHTQVAGSSIGHPQSYYGTANFGNLPGKTTAWAVSGLQEFHGNEIYLTEALTRKALQLLDYPVKEKKPFFLHLAHYAVHVPLQPDYSMLSRYASMGLDSTEAAYASMIEGMDRSLGMVMDYLEKNHLTDNTLLLFLSDNGGLSAAGRGGIPHTHNHPLRSGKGSVYEGGIRIPMIVSWPGRVREAAVCHQPVGIEDIFPTLLEAAGIPLPPSATPADGISLLPLFNGRIDDVFKTKTILIHYPHRWTNTEEEGIAWTSGLISGNWKVVYLMKQQQLALYDLSNDIGEQHDLSRAHPVQLKKMALLLGETLRSHQAQQPTWKSDGKMVAWPDALVE